MPIAQEVQRVQPLSRADFFDRFERADVPVVIAGAVAGSTAVRTWSPESLLQRFGALQATFKVSSSNAHPDFRQSSLQACFAREGASFADFLRHITEGPEPERARRLFTGDEQFLLRRRDGVTTIDPQFGALLDDLPLPELVPKEQLYTAWAWFSGRGVRTWLHYDNNYCHNLNAQITGAKECVLFAPDELARLAPFPLGGHNPAYNCSQIDVERVDSDRFPEFGGIRCWRATLEAGDLLFIPAFWFHTFLHTGQFNSNLNFWWRPEQLRPTPVLRRQALLDAVSAAKIDAKQGPEAGVLAALDQAIIGARSRPSG